MPCWYFEKSDLRNTPSLLVGIEPAVEARYRREGARFIIDAGTKMGLRFDTCATGVVYYHRFYMFHSFQEFNRYVTAACCLFLAGKVEETPKKCKDIIKTCRSLLTDAQFTMFGGDPREEVMTMERILLQTIKFDLQVNHAYACVLKFAKNIIGDKDKIQKVVQMAWTFVNDSLCTTLCLQWEPEIIGASMLYLATKLSKVEISDWQGRHPELKLKWYEAFVEGLSQELIEDVCHQVLDLYSASADKAQASPPPSSQPQTNLTTPSSVEKKTHQTPAVTPETSQEVSNKSLKKEPTRSIDTSNEKTGHESRSSSVASNKSYERAPASSAPSAVASLASGPASQPSSEAFSLQNPYISSNMYSSSYLSAEGSESIQSVMNQGTSMPSPYPAGPPPVAYPPVQPVSSMPVRPVQYPQHQAAYPPVAAPGSTYPPYPPMSEGIYSHGPAHPSTYDQGNAYPTNFEAAQYPPPMNISYPPPSHLADTQQQYPTDYEYPPPSQHLYPPDNESLYPVPGYSNQPLTMGPRPSEIRPQHAKPGPGLPLIRITGRRR